MTTSGYSLQYATLMEYREGQVLVVGPGAGEQLAANASAVRDWVRDGGQVVALGLTGEEASAFLPAQVTTTPGEHIASCFEAVGTDSPLVGVSPADVHNRDPRELPLVTDGATPVGEGEQRWLDGLYLDVPEEWDDPYRFFRW